MSKAARLHGTFLPVVALTDLTRLNWDQRGATLGRDAEASSELFSGGNSLQPLQAILTHPVTFCDSKM